MKNFRIYLLGTIVMLSISTLATDSPKGKIIDIHFHANARRKDGGDLPKVAKWMEENCVQKIIIMQYRKTLPRNDQEARQLIENFNKYKGRLYRFCVLLPAKITSKEEAVKLLKKEKGEGAIGFGEHYGRKLDFDDPQSMRLYQACAEVGLPVLFHMDNNNNKDDGNLSHLENALKKFPACFFIGHGPGFWKKMKTVDKLLDKYKNLYVDISAGSGARAIGKDKKYSRDFIKRHADNVLFGTDGGPWSFGKKPPPQFELIKKLDLPSDVKTKVFYKNAEALFNLVDEN